MSKDNDVYTFCSGAILSITSYLNIGIRGITEWAIGIFISGIIGGFLSAFGKDAYIWIKKKLGIKQNQ